MSSNEDYLENLLKSMGEEDQSLEVPEENNVQDENVDMDDLNLEELLDLIDDDDLNEINDLLRESTSDLPDTVEELNVTPNSFAFDEESLEDVSTEDTVDLLSMLGLENETEELQKEELEAVTELEEISELNADLFELEELEESESNTDLFGLEELEESEPQIDLFGMESSDDVSKLQAVSEEEQIMSEEDELKLQQESMDLLQNLMGLDEQIFAEQTTEEELDVPEFDFLDDATELLDMVEQEPIGLATPVQEQLTEFISNKKESFWMRLYHFLFTAKEIEELEEFPMEDEKKDSKKRRKKKEVDSSNGDDEGETKELTEEEQKKAEKAAKKEAKKKAKEAKKQMKLSEVEEISELYTKKNITRIVVICMSILVMIIVLFLVLEKLSFNRLAEKAYNEKEYTTAYGILYGKELNESQSIIYERSSMILLITNKYNLYESYLQNGENNLAVDALIEGVAMYDALEDEIAEYHTVEEMQAAFGQIQDALSIYGISVERARELMEIESNTEYQKEISNILKQ